MGDTEYGGKVPRELSIVVIILGYSYCAEYPRVYSDMGVGILLHRVRTIDRPKWNDYGTDVAIKSINLSSIQATGFLTTIRLSG